MVVIIIGAFITRRILEYRGIDCDLPVWFRISNSNAIPQTPSSSTHASPIVRLPQGTYEGCVVAVGQGMVESIGLGLGLGSDGESGRTRAERVPAALPVSRQMALPKNLDVFLGIPFAQSTGGDNRFRSPAPLGVDPRGIDAGTGAATVPIPATRLGQRCPGTAPNPFIPEGEDCLNLNVYRPATQDMPSASLGARSGTKQGRASSALPVVIYVHGGGFNNGMGVERDMASFVGYAESDVIGVSFNYRVGALGFLGWVEDAGDAGDAQVPSTEAAPLNLGLRDQQALFHWVQKNIAYFGGDPGNVSIMGLSAGAHSIGHHLMYYRPGGPEAPFHKAILESGGPTARAVWDKSHPRPTAQLRDFLVAAGILGGESAGPPSRALSHDEILNRLRQLPLGTIVGASRKVWNDYSASVCWPFQPVVDGQIIPQTPLNAWRSRLDPGLPPSQIPIMTGFNSNEGTMFVPGDISRADTDEHFRAFFTDLVPGLTSDDLDELCRVYPDPVTDPESPYRMPEGAFPPGVSGRQWARLEAAYAHYAYICPVLQTAHYASSSPSPSAAKVFVYEYAAHASGWNTANHGDNQSAVAHSMAVLRGNPGLLAVADAMNTAWVRFAVSGHPNGPEDGNVAGVRWEPFVTPFASAETRQLQPASTSLMVFGQGNDERVPPEQRSGGPEAKPGTTAAPRALSDYELAQCRFWWDRVELSQGSGRRDEVLAARTQRLAKSLL